MTDDTPPEPAGVMPASGPTATANTVKVAAIVTLLPSLMAVLPPGCALSICVTMITCAAITASVPAPTHGRVLVGVYQVVRVVGLGVKYAIPYVATHLARPSLPRQGGTP